MPPELLPIIIQWGPVALILFGILYRADQLARALFPVVVEHFKKLGEAFDSMKIAVENQTHQTAILAKMADRLEEMGSGLSEDHQTIADDAKSAHHHSRRAADAAEEILLRIPQRLIEKEGA